MIVDRTGRTGVTTSLEKLSPVSRRWHSFRVLTAGGQFLLRNLLIAARPISKETGEMVKDLVRAKGSRLPINMH